MIIYRYEHVDVHIHSNKESFRLYKEFNEECLTSKQLRRKYYREKNKVAKLFKKFGWEGDGQIKVLWIAPFLIENSDTHGELVWHVKQNSNGISFIATSDYSNANIFGY